MTGIRLPVTSAGAGVKVVQLRPSGIEVSRQQRRCAGEAAIDLWNQDGAPNCPVKSEDRIGKEQESQDLYQDKAEQQGNTGTDDHVWAL